MLSIINIDYAGALGLPSLFHSPFFLPVYLRSNVGPPIPQSTASLGPPSTPCSESSSPSCASPPLLLVWMNVSSFIPWLLDFHTIRFSKKFWLFFVFKLFLSFFCLCEEAQCVYLCLHLGQKSLTQTYFNTL